MLYKDTDGTIGHTDASKKNFERLIEEADNIGLIHSGVDENVRFAGMIVTWNVFQHFYPYFHVTNSDWDNQLRGALENTANDKSRDDYIDSLLELVEKSGDGHAHSINLTEKYVKSRGYMPFIADIIEDEVVVTVAESDSGLQLGDIIISKDGVETSKILEQIKSEVAGSPQWKSFVASERISAADSVELEITRDNKIIDVSVKGFQYLLLDKFNRTEPFKELDDGIYYFDSNHNVNPTFMLNIETLAEAKGIIFDMRGYPAVGANWLDIIAHLIEKPIKGPISKVMQSIYPNQENVTFMELQNEIIPSEPIIRGEVVFLSYAGSISHPEYILGHIKDNGIGEIVGQPTAGADGNVRDFSIPGNIVEKFTGLEVLNADGSQTHLIGIEPTVPIERTIEAVRNGEDEYITKALELIKSKSSK